MKTYKIEDSNKKDEQKKIIVEEETTTTKKRETTIEDLKSKIRYNKKKIKWIREDINRIIDEMKEIGEQTGIKVEDPPKKIELEDAEPEKITIKEEVYEEEEGM